MDKKIVTKVMLILISMILILSTPLYSTAFSFDSLIEAGDSFIEEGNASEADGLSEEDLKPISDSMSNVLLVIAVGVTLITAVMMAINFTIKSVEEKADIKKSMIPWVIGIFITFGAYGIWRITMSIFYNL